MRRRPEPIPPALEQATTAMAWGRAAWGVAAYLAPRTNARLAGVGDRTTAEVVYLTRVFGSRALALGLGYLASTPGARPLWRRLGLVVDIGDTAAGLVHVVRGDVPRRAAASLTLVTGTYALIGLADLARSLRSRPSPDQDATDDRTDQQPERRETEHPEAPPHGGRDRAPGTSPPAR